MCQRQEETVIYFIPSALERYDSTIVLLTPCLQEKRFSNEQKQRAYRLVALSYFANRDLESSKDWIDRLVHEHRDYLIDPNEDPLFFQQWVDRYRPKKWHQKRSVRIGIPVAIGLLSTAAYFIFRTEPVTPLPLLGGILPPPPGGN